LWDVIKHDLIKLFAQLQQGDIPCLRLTLGDDFVAKERRCGSNSAV
jgi:hypothetical protein